MGTRKKAQGGPRTKKHYVVVDITDEKKVTGSFPTLEEAKDNADEKDIILEVTRLIDIRSELLYVEGDINDYFTN